VIEQDGSRMSVATALALINDKLQGILWDQESEFDRETRAAVAWYDEYGWAMGDSGRAEQVAFGKNTTIKGLVQADIMWSQAGDSRLVRLDELPVEGYDPAFDHHPTIWQLTLLLSALLEKQGIEKAARLMAAARARHIKVDSVKNLALLLYTIGEHKRRTDDQLRFNSLVTIWPDLVNAARHAPASMKDDQLSLDDVLLPSPGG
jgi:putative DNA methylase